MLDAACGSGNFLYVAIHMLLDLEKEVITYASDRGLSPIPQVNPAQLHGLEINPYAQELAQVVVWIGYLQWMHYNGFKMPDHPVLTPIETIKQMDGEKGDIFFGESDRNWILEGASVHVSMVGFDDGLERNRILDGRLVEAINANLSSAADVVQAKRLQQNESIAFIGSCKGGPFDIEEREAMGLSASTVLCDCSVTLSVPSSAFSAFADPSAALYRPL